MICRYGEDKSQQSELLKKCVECWAGDGASDGPDPDNVALQKLTAFVEEQQALSWSQIIDIMHRAGINAKLTLRLCEGLLSRSPDDEEMWKAQKEVLVKYVTILCAGLAQQQVRSWGNGLFRQSCNRCLIDPQFLLLSVFLAATERQSHSTKFTAICRNVVQQNCSPLQVESLAHK